MNEIAGLIANYRSAGMLVDANLLILRLVGRMNPKRIENFDRTSSFDREDYVILENLLAQFSKTITTPHVLTEVSNLAGKLQRRELLRVRELLRYWIATTLEVHQPAATLVADTVFRNFGLTDAAMGSLCKRDGFLLLTADVPLYGLLSNRGLDVINFRQIQAIRRING